MIDWLKGIFSLEERRYSTLMLAFICFCTVAIYRICYNIDVSNNVKEIIEVLGGYVCGINALPIIKSLFNKTSGITSEVSAVGTIVDSTTSNTTTNSTNSPV